MPPIRADDLANCSAASADIMDVTCDDFCGQAFWPGSGSCRPTTSFESIFLEHGTLALVQLAKSAWLAVGLLCLAMGLPARF